MAEFKKLSAVETVESVSDAATVLIEENGVIKKAPKDEIGTDMKKLGAVETVESISDTANVLIEEDGIIKKAPKTAVGGIEADMIIRVVESGEGIIPTIISGNYDEVSQKLENENPILIYAFITFLDGSKSMAVPDTIDRWVYDDGTNRTVLSLAFVDSTLVIFPDNTIAVD